jgi:hypothetical protein
VDHQRDSTIKEMTVTNNNKNNSATSENHELTDDELNVASGGIIFVGGEPTVAATQSTGSAPGSSVAAKIISGDH